MIALFLLRKHYKNYVGAINLPSYSGSSELELKNLLQK